MVAEFPEIGGARGGRRRERWGEVGSKTELDSASPLVAEGEVAEEEDARKEKEREGFYLKPDFPKITENHPNFLNDSKCTPRVKSPSHNTFSRNYKIHPKLFKHTLTHYNTYNNIL